MSMLGMINLILMEIDALLRRISRHVDAGEITLGATKYGDLRTGNMLMIMGIQTNTQKGDKTHTNEAFGSDLDGDLYFFTWDENLIPPSKRSRTPMEYISQESKLLACQVTTRDIVEFYVRNMVNENLGAICNAHVVHANLSDYGTMDQKCVTLAKLVATAVDFPKIGKIIFIRG